MIVIESNQDDHRIIEQNREVKCLNEVENERKKEKNETWTLVKRQSIKMCSPLKLT